MLAAGGIAAALGTLAGVLGAELAAGDAFAAALSHDTQAPIIFDAQSAEVDLKTNTSVFKKVRIAQGNLVVTADSGQATRHTSALNFDDNVWEFHGNVKITMDDGQLNSDDAQITFANKLLTAAVANGKPATFEQHLAKTGKLAEGKADSIDYDVRRGTVRLSKNAWLSDGQNEMRGEMLKYNVSARTVIADAAEQGAQRVHIIITPPPKSGPASPTP